MRLNLFARLFLTIGGCTAGAIAIAIVLQDHSLGRNLDRAAQARVERSARAAATLLQSHLETTTERYAAIARSPRTAAIVDETDIPTLTHRAEEIRVTEGSILIAFLDHTGAPTARVGPRAFDPSALSAVGLTVFDGEPAVAVRVPVRRGTRELGTMVALEPIATPTLRAWSSLIGADIVLDTPGGDSSRLSHEVPIPGSTALHVTTHLEQELAAQAEARWTLLAAGFLALGCALVVSVFLSRGFTRPILAIRRATEGIGSGDLSSRVAVTRRDEIGEVAQSVNRMAERLQSTSDTIRISNETLLETNATLARARERAEQASIEKSERLAERSPRVRPLLDEISAHLALLDESSLPEGAHRAVEGVRGANETLRRGIEAVFDLAWIETDRLEFDTVDFSPGRCAEEAVAACADLPTSEGIRLATFVDPHTPNNVRGDPVRFAQVVSHLVHNALEHSGSDEVVVSVWGGKRTEDAVEVIVKVLDRGNGFPELTDDQTEKLSTREPTAARGIGLTIVEHLCTRTGGRFSLGPARGGGTEATATVRLPIAQWQDSPLTSRLRSVDLETLRILVHDPAPDVRQALIDQVRGWGISTEVEEDATKIADRVRDAAHAQDPFHIVLVALPTRPNFVATEGEDAATGAVRNPIFLPAWVDELIENFEERPSLRATRLVALAPTARFDGADLFADVIVTPASRESLLDFLIEARGAAPRRDARRVRFGD